MILLTLSKKKIEQWVFVSVDHGSMPGVLKPGALMLLFSEYERQQ